MPVVISMLRGINLAANNRIRMDALRALYESQGLEDVQSYVQSGNIVYRTAKRDLEKIARRLEAAILDGFAIRTTVVQRTAAEMRAVVEGNPFTGRGEVEPGKLLVTFFGAHPAKEDCERCESIAIGPEEMHLRGREMYVYFPNGQGQSKFPAAALEKTLKTKGTARNWNSVTRLLELGERLAATGAVPA